MLLGTAGFEGIGNELGNRIVGTGRANRLVGGGGDDVLEGGFGNDLLEGGSAQDTLLGSRGKDVFVGGSGNDLMVGHGGTDRALYAGAASDYVITALDGGRWRIVHAATGDADTLTGVDRLDFDDGRVYLAANRAVQARLDRLRLTEDGPGATLNLLANDRDPDRDAFALVSVNGDTDGTLAGPFGTLAWAANGDATWTPDPASPALQAIRRDARHTEVFTYVVRDAEGLESQGELRIMITGANDAPTATASFLTVKSDATGTGRLAADDVDSDDGPDSLVYELVGGVPAGKGTLVLGPGGTFSFNPGDAFADLAPGASEDVTITWRATDRHGASTGNQTLTITVTADSATGVVAKPVISGILEYTGTPGDGITTDRTLTIHGTGNAGNRIEVSVDGQLVGSAIVAANGTWSVADATVRDDGDYAITAVAVGAGQTTSGPSDPFTAVVDTAAPGAPALGLAASSDTGERGDGVTALARVTLTGTAEAGATIEVLGTTVRALVAGDGRVTLPDVLLAPGENTLALRITDVAGNSRDAILDLRREESSPGGDPVRAWNQLTLDIIRADATTPAVATRAMAMESIAVLDTLAAIDGTPAFMVGLDAPEGVSAGVAVAAAAHRVLSYLYPSRTAPLNERLASDLATMPAGAARDASVEFGRAVADAVIAIRDRDGWNAFATFDGGTEPGEWRPTGPSFEVAQAPHWAALTPFTLQSGDQFRADGPPDFDSAEYAAALNEVKSLGSATSATRTAEQTQIARFWADGAGSYTPPGHWNQIAAEIAAQQGYELGAAARILAMLNITLADSSIAAWDTKYAEGFWRPVTAIRLADTDGNAATAADAAWQPLLLTPPHPEYVSGHSTYSAAAATILTEIFGEMSFSTTSIGLPGVTRSFDSFLDAAQEAGRSRIYGGIHFEFSNQDGQGLGTDIATWVLGSFATDRDVRAPVVLVDQAPGAVAATIPDLTGFALDNLAGLSSLTVRLGDGAAQSVAVDSRGRFALDTDGVFGALADGTHTLTFTARDAAGNATSQAFSFVLDRAAPTLNVSSLADGDELEAGARLTGRVDGTGSGITSFSYVLGSGPAVPITFDKATGAFDVALDLSKLAPGAVTLTLSARDAAGNLLTQQLSLDMPSAVPFAIASVLPAADAVDIGVTFHPQLRFTRAVDPATLTPDSFYAVDAAGAKLPASIVVAADGLSAWLFFEQPLPGGTRITLQVDGEAVRTAGDGAPLDGDRDGTPGGDLATGFTTVSRAVVPGTSIEGFVVGPGADLKPMTYDDFRAGPDGAAHTPDDVFLERLAGVRVWILGMEDKAVFTDAQGRFVLDEVPAGVVKLAIDGRTATNGPEGSFYPEMVMDLTIRPGVVNTVMGSMGSTAEQVENAERGEVYLPRIPLSVLTPISNDAPTEVTTPAEGAPNLTDEQREAIRLVVQPGSAIGEDGQVLGEVQVGISTVPPELVRDMLPPGLMQHTFDLTIQAPGVTVFDQAIQLRLPNVFEAPPGTKLNILNFDPTTGRLVIDGTGTVSEDGQYVLTDPGTGITRPGWHGMTTAGSNTKGPPPPPPPPPCQDDGSDAAAAAQVGKALFDAGLATAEIFATQPVIALQIARAVATAANLSFNVYKFKELADDIKEGLQNGVPVSEAEQFLRGLQIVKDSTKSLIEDSAKLLSKDIENVTDSFTKYDRALTIAGSAIAIGQAVVEELRTDACGKSNPAYDNYVAALDAAANGVKALQLALGGYKARLGKLGADAAKQLAIAAVDSVYDSTTKLGPVSA